MDGIFIFEHFVYVEWYDNINVKNFGKLKKKIVKSNLQIKSSYRPTLTRSYPQFAIYSFRTVLLVLVYIQHFVTL